MDYGRYVLHYNLVNLTICRTMDIYTMEFKTKHSLKFKEELPPINRPTRSASIQVIKVITKKKVRQKSLFLVHVFNFQNNKELIKPTELFNNKIDPLILVAQYEREVSRIKMIHTEMLKELHKEIEILRSKNRGTMH